MSEFLDEVARALARPMPRRRALRFIGGALVTAAVPAAFPRRAWGRRNDCNARGGGCQGNSYCCYASDGFAGSCCPVNFSCSKNSGLCAEEIFCEDGRSFCGDPARKTCCPPEQVCFKGVCVTPCPPDQVVCKGDCCPKGAECARFTFGGRRVEVCTPKCPKGRTRCGPNCCPSRFKCKDPDRGLCSRCGTGEEPCGTKCCNRKTSFCGDPAHNLCCPKNASSCPTGPVTSPRRTCCQRPNRCARQLPAQSGGLTRESPYVCCPPNRIVPDDSGNPLACCAPGQISLGGKLLVGSGIQGLCCEQSQICGSGSSVTCCQTFSPTIGTDLNQTCCSGKCVTLQYDPANCGACGRACSPGQRCNRGVCVA